MGRTTTAHADARTQEIRRAAAAVIARKGSERATMAEIAREVGLSPGALYLYFSNKDDLLEQVCVGKLTEVEAMFASAESNVESPLSGLYNVGQAFAEMFDAEGYLDDVLVSLEVEAAGARDPEGLGALMAEQTRAVLERIEGLVRAAQTSGEIDPGIEPGTLAEVLYAFGLGLRHLKLTTQGAVDARTPFALMMDMVGRLAPRQS